MGTDYCWCFERPREAAALIDDLEARLAASEALVRELEEANKLMGVDLVTRHDRICTLAEALRVARGALESHAHKDGCVNCINTLANIDALMKGAE